MLCSLHHNNAGTPTALIPQALTRKIIFQFVDNVVVLEFPLFSANELDHTKGCGKCEKCRDEEQVVNSHCFLEDLAEREYKNAIV